MASATPPAHAYPRPAAVASCMELSPSVWFGSIPFAANIASNSSNVITKSTSLRTVLLLASSFLAAHGPINTTFAFGCSFLMLLAVATIGVSSEDTLPIKSGNCVFASMDHAGQQDVSKNGSSPVAT